MREVLGMLESSMSVGNVADHVTKCLVFGSFALEKTRSAWKPEALEMCWRAARPTKDSSKHGFKPPNWSKINPHFSRFCDLFLGYSGLSPARRHVHCRGTRFDNPPVFQAAYLISTVKEVTIQINLKTSTNFRVRPKKQRGVFGISLLVR